MRADRLSETEPGCGVWALFEGERGKAGTGGCELDDAKDDDCEDGAGLAERM